MTVVLESAPAALKSGALSPARVEWCLRIGAAACFIGHGAFGVLTKDAWVAYFGVFGIGRDLAYTLMPVVGTVDIMAGLTVLLSPRPIVLAYMTVWATITALLRPLAGESAFETLERAGNYGVPLALMLWYAWPRTRGAWFARAVPRTAPDRVLTSKVLLATTSTLLIAHGALAAITRKPLFDTLYGAAGLPSGIAPYLGALEIVVGILVLVAPVPALLVAIAAWKIASESLFPISGTPIWEFVERGGSYVAPIALVLLAEVSPFTRITFSRSIR